jgi:hypothetical protein
VVGTTPSGASSDAYVVHDATATAPNSGQTTPQYCYGVRAVDAAGDVSLVSAVAGPVTAAAAVVVTMAFVADGTVVTGANTVQVRYSAPVDPATLVTSGTQFRVAATSGDVTTNLPVTGAALGGASTDVVLTLAVPIPSAGSLTVTAQAPTGGSTVCTGTSATDCQPAGQVVAVARDTTAPTFAMASAALNGAGADTLTLQYSEAVVAFGGTYASPQFFYDPDCDGGFDRVPGVVSQATATSLSLKLPDGSLLATDDANDCLQYVDDNPGAVDAGDVVDTSGNAQVSPSTVTVPAATA